MEGQTLFLCGECLDPEFLSRFPVPISLGEPCVLPGYRLSATASGRSYLCPSPSEQAEGRLCSVSHELLWAMDQWKGLPILRREEVETASGPVQVYLENALCPAPASKGLSGELDAFLRLREKNELGRCDLHLIFPCSFEDFSAEKAQGAAEEISKRLSRTLANVSSGEFAGEDLVLDRGGLGVFAFAASNREEDRDDYVQPGFLHYSIHASTKVGTLSVVFPQTLVSALRIMDVFCGNHLYLFTDKGREEFLTWLPRQWGIKIHGSPKALLFALDELTKDKLVRCLAMEEKPADKITGPTLLHWAEDDFAQYDLARVFVSNKCMVEKTPGYPDDLYERLDCEAVEIFFVELLSMQIASIHRICQRVLQYLREGGGANSEEDYSALLSLDSEMSSAVLFFDYNHFLYPTVAIACKKISQRFGMEEEMEKYNTYRAILEQKISLAAEQREKISGSNLNLLLLILTLVQVLPTFVETFQMCLAGTWTPDILLSWVLSILACIVLCGLFSWYKRRQIRRAVQKWKRSS